MTQLDEMLRQDRVWKERRMVSGHGAQDGSAVDPDYKALIVFLGGPIKHWWDENWMTSEHFRYDEWRSKVEDACIAAGFLVYKPYTAWKGTWNEEAQELNDAVIRVIDVFIDMSPPGVPSKGTAEEKILAKELGTQIVEVGPPAIWADDDEVLNDLTEVLTEMADEKNHPMVKEDLSHEAMVAMSREYARRGTA